MSREARQDDRRQDPADASRREDQGRSGPEWITFLISLGIVLALIGFLIYQALTGDRSPPVVEVRPLYDQVEQVSNGHTLPVEVANTGQRTAEDVEIGLTVTGPAGQTETVQIRIGFLPGGGSEEAVVVFQDRPDESKLRVDGISFLGP